MTMSARYRCRHGLGLDHKRVEFAAAARHASPRRRLGAMEENVDLGYSMRFVGRDLVGRGVMRPAPGFSQRSRCGAFEPAEPIACARAVGTRGPAPRDVHLAKKRWRGSPQKISLTPAAS